MELKVKSQEEAIEIARTLTQAANSVRMDCTLHDIEQTARISKILAIRDSIKIRED